MPDLKHTRGSWGCTTRQGSWDWVVYSENNPNIEICQMFHDGTETNETGEANAHVAAAAPEMLTALKSAHVHLEHMAKFIGDRQLGYSFEGLGEDIGNIRAAIAKAEGGNNAG